MDPARWAPYLLTLFGLPVDGGRLAHLGREELNLCVFDTLRRVAVETSKREPLVIEVEDLQLFGKTAREFLLYLVENLSGARILLLTTYGPRYRPAWIGKSYVTQMPVPPLSRHESLALVGTILPAGGFSERSIEAILAKAEGNPFFLEELARSTAAGETEVDLPVPDTVRALVESRLDELGDEACRLLRMAAAIGRRVPARLLELVGGGRSRLEEQIAVCKRMELIQEEIVDDEPVYVFKDALVWEVAHQSLSPGDRQALRQSAGLSD
jgi:predicted ATPase